MNYIGRNRNPTKKDILFQFYVNLAYGFNGFTHFCYYTPDVGAEFTEDCYAMVGRDNKRTDIYDAVKRVNFEIRTLEPFYFMYRWKGVYVNTVNGCAAFDLLKDSIAIEDIRGIENIRSDGDILSGYFQNQDGGALLIVNYSDPSSKKSVKVFLELSEGFIISAVHEKGIHKTCNIQEGTVFELREGEGIFVEFSS